MLETRNVLEQIGLAGVIPVAVIENENDAVPVAEALQAGGLPLIEVTFRTASARNSIERIATTHPEILLGAGTVLSVQQAEEALGAGAKFIVSPGLNPDVMEYCRSREITMIPES